MKNPSKALLLYRERRLLLVSYASKSPSLFPASGSSVTAARRSLHTLRREGGQGGHR